METYDEGADALTAEESWQTIHATMDDARSSMYLAGSAAIMLLWGVVTSVGCLSMYGVYEFAPGFAEERPWFPGPLWFVLAMTGSVGSSILGGRAGKRLASGTAARNAGLRVFSYWMTLTAGGWLILAAGGLLSGDSWEPPVRAGVGLVALGYILFGIMTRLVFVATGAGIAASFYIPHFLLDDAALGVTGVMNLATFGLAFLWIRRTGEW